MFKLVLRFLLVTLATAKSDSFDINEDEVLVRPVFRTSAELNNHIKHTSFSSLDNYQDGARLTNETKYPWIARVVHSRSSDTPHMCTAACIDRGIFITAARCIFTLKVKVTSVIYMSKRYAVRAFVFPSKPTQQMFDDIGFIVVKTKMIERAQWAVIELYNFPNRTDDVFKWFGEITKSNITIDYRVVGYASEKKFYRLRAPERKFDLTELDVKADIGVCVQVLVTRGDQDNGYDVPCYHACTREEMGGKPSAECQNYHGVEGGALFDTVTNKLVGIATWGGHDKVQVMPVGFATMNSDNFFKDYTCAKRIRDDDGLLITKGYYQNLCDRNV